MGAMIENKALNYLHGFAWSSSFFPGSIFTDFKGPKGAKWSLMSDSVPSTMAM
jgi:hypothetical protein